MSSLKRIALLSLLAGWAGCAPEEPAKKEAEPTMSAVASEGLVIKKGESGGEAERERVGVLKAIRDIYERERKQKKIDVSGRKRDNEGRFGKRDKPKRDKPLGNAKLGSRHVQQAETVYGLGHGYGGIGGLGSGGGGFGMGRGGGATGQEYSNAFGSSSERDEFVEPSAFEYAELQQPYREGQAAHFEKRAGVEINSKVTVREDMLSTFAVDVDTAAYAIARKTILSGRWPEPTSVRVEELVNYFRYGYEPPNGDRQLFSIEADGARSPFPGGEHIFRVGLQARVVSDADRLPANLVFLVDTSCSMTSEEKLGLAKTSLKIAVEHLRPDDRVAVSTYAGGVRVVLPPTSVREKAKILAALDSLESGGGTAMSSGLKQAYELAGKMLGPNRITRVIVCSDGDANIGNTGPEEMLKEIASWVSEGVTLSTIGFGDGNYKDSTMETIANKGNGNYFYVDTVQQAKRVFGRDLTKMIQDVAQDVKIQVAFNPEAVERYRLIGYENRAVKDEDFRDDRVDAGEIGAGHQVTALYALILAPKSAGPRTERLATIHVRAKKPRGMTAKETSVEVPVNLVDRSFDEAPDDLRFATAVMGAAEIFRKSPHAASWTLDQVEDIAEDTVNEDPDRSELLSLIDRAQNAQLAQR